MRPGQASRLTALAAAGAWLAAGPALAKPGDAACLWGAVPQAQKDAFYAAYSDKGPNVAGMLNETAAPAALACGLGDKATSLTTDALISAALKDASARELLLSYTVDEARLQAAWDGLDPAVRDQFAKDAVAYSEKPEGPIPGRDLAGQLAAQLGLAEPKAGLHILMHFFAAAVASYEDGRL